MDHKRLFAQVAGDGRDDVLSALYGRSLQREKERILAAIDVFARRFGVHDEVMLLSVPGRTEICGNHTDHNRGRVLAAAVSLDIIAVAAPVKGQTVTLLSEGFPEDTVDLNHLEPLEEEKGHSAALIRGVARGMKDAGFAVGGFVAYTTSRVLKGSGLSSSAAFEVLVANLFSHLYNGGRLPAEEAAKISQYAENHFFGKPCGLMDQMACSLGGLVEIDFADPQHPMARRVGFGFDRTGYRLCIVDTRGDHRNLTPAYAAIPQEMGAVAAALGGQYLRECDSKALYTDIPSIRACCGDRAFLRAAHFFMENERVGRQINALEREDFDSFLRLVNESGRSSFMYLQNVSTPEEPQNQGVAVGLCLAEWFLQGDGAQRVHGGGFAGTIQVYLPQQRLEAFVTLMESVFGMGCCYNVSIRQAGGIRIL